ncbi:pyruvate kinase-like [Zophobas morio]|uniref:pyruvate kinase-like n=1 Tax=Zophobas morio TaxID=2755281 RepID=UPI00308328A5
MVWSTVDDFEESETECLHCAPPKQLVASHATSYLDHACELDVNSAPSYVRLTGIICTIGPSSSNVDTLERMMETGMNIARLNFSHGSHEEHAQSIQNIRTAANNYSTRLGLEFPMAIAVDVKGPEIRIGYFEGGIDAEVELRNGEQIKLTTDKAYFEKGSASVMYIDYDNIQKVVQVGNRIYIDSGVISLICTNIQGSVLTCTIEHGGTLGGCKGVNLPGVAIDLPVVSLKDKEDLRFGVEQNIDIIFASYIREAAALTELRDVLGHNGRRIKIIAKIENQQGVENIDEIIKASDGIMIGRSDLGIELPVEKLFLAQKSIIAKCNTFGKPVICANQLLHSMTKKPRPTRAECTDVANAVLDGADCVMLSIETAKGEYPVETIQTMAKICKEAESAFWQREFFHELSSKVIPPLEPAHAIAIAAVETAAKCLAAAIIVITSSGRSAFLLSKYRPHCPILAITRYAQTARQANLHRGILPLIYTVERQEDWTKDTEFRISFGVSFGKWKGFIRAGDPVVVISGSRKGSGNTDTLRVLYVTKSPDGEPCVCDMIDYSKLYG